MAKRLLEYWREIQWQFFASIIGAFAGGFVHNQFMKEFVILDIESRTIMVFLGALIAVTVTEIYQAKKHPKVTCNGHEE